MRHIAFFHELAACQAEETPRFYEVGAGCLVLRLFDSWAWGTYPTRQSLGTAISAVHTWVARLPSGDGRQLLDGILTSILHSRWRRPASTVTSLLAYATWLECQAYESLALDVLYTAEEALAFNPAAAPDLVTSVKHRIDTIAARTGTSAYDPGPSKAFV